MPDSHFISEGWIAAAGATLGAILLKLMEKLLQRKKERFEESLTVQNQADERIKSLWSRIDVLQSERDSLWARFHQSEEQHDDKIREAERKYSALESKYNALNDRYNELRILLRGRNIPPGLGTEDDT